MDRLDELRALRASRQKRVVLSFAVWSVILLAVTAGTAFFTSYFEEYPALRVLPFALFLLGISLTKLHLFFRPKEFSGTVVYLNVAVELRKKYLSGQPGVKLAANEVKVMELIVENERGKTLGVSVPYRREYKDLRAGDRVVVLRFVEEIHRLA